MAVYSQLDEAEVLALARGQYERDFEVSFDDNPEVAEADDGYWVQAWVRVEKPEVIEL